METERIERLEALVVAHEHFLRVLLAAEPRFEQAARAMTPYLDAMLIARPVSDRAIQAVLAAVSRTLGSLDRPEAG